MEKSAAARLERALDSLEGLSVGDAFGECYFGRILLATRQESELIRLLGKPELDDYVREVIEDRFLSPAPWEWTDDTALALEIVANLREHGKIDPDSLAKSFSRRFFIDPQRGYGGAMHSLLPDLRSISWREAAPALFGGTGSFGNGAAMRVAPLGAYFADDPEECAHNAELSSQVTHAHPEGIAGGIAVALAACFAARTREGHEEGDILSYVLPFVPAGRVRESLKRAQALSSATPTKAATELGSGYAVAAQDTVAFCLWCAARNLDDYEEALWETVEGLGDRDTTCAIVGGIVAARTGARGIPEEWRQNREPLGAF